MAWMKLETSVARNKKFVRAGPAPSWLWVCGLAYCQDGLTDGFIPFEAIHYLGVRNACRLAESLVSSRLWDVVEGGWQVHDYLEYNRSASDVESIRTSRAAGGSLGGRPTKNLPDNLPHAPKVSQEVSLDKPSEKPQGFVPENPSTVQYSTATATATDHKELKAAAAPRQVFNRLVENPKAKDDLTPSAALLRKLAYQVLDDNPNAEFGDLMETLKDKCARVALGHYSAETVGAALETAIRLRQLDETKTRIGSTITMTRQERERAETMRRAWGRCEHTPTCGSQAECIQAIVRSMRGQKTGSVALGVAAEVKQEG